MNVVLRLLVLMLSLCGDSGSGCMQSHFHFKPIVVLFVVTDHIIFSCGH